MDAYVCSVIYGYLHNVLLRAIYFLLLILRNY